MAPALAAGNCVVMKPAELTPLSSLKIAQLMAGGRFPRRRGQHRPGPRLGRRSVHGRASGDREDRLHRIDRHRPAHRAGVRRQPEEGAARTRRQGRQHRVRGRRSSRRRWTARRSRSSTTRARPASPARGSCCTRRSPTSSWRSSSGWRSPIKLGNPMEPTTEMGPLTSAGHRDRVLSYVQVAKDQGGQVLLGGKAPERRGAREGLLHRADHRAREAHRSRVAGGGVRSLRDR